MSKSLIYFWSRLTPANRSNSAWHTVDVLKTVVFCEPAPSLLDFILWFQGLGSLSRVLVAIDVTYV